MRSCRLERSENNSEAKSEAEDGRHVKRAEAPAAGEPTGTAVYGLAQKRPDEVPRIDEKERMLMRRALLAMPSAPSGNGNCAVASENSAAFSERVVGFHLTEQDQSLAP
ncbi:hypothetical protein MRX96_027217 [Rhipicephalus microplus]